MSRKINKYISWKYEIVGGIAFLIGIMFLIGWNKKISKNPKTQELILEFLN